MDFKTFIREKKHSLRDIALRTGIPYSTLNDIANGKTQIDRVRLGHVRAICDCLNIAIDELITLCDAALPSLEVDGGTIFIRNKCYYLHYEAGGQAHDRYLCKVTPLNTQYVRTMAEWDLEEIREQEELDAWQPSTI